MGYFYAFLVAFGYGTSNFYVKKGMQEAAEDIGIFYTLIINTCTAFFLCILILPKTQFSLDVSGISFFILAGIMGPILGRVTFYSAIQKIGITLSTTIKITSPVFAAFIAYLTLHENLSHLDMLGILIVMLGLFFLINNKTKNTKVTENIHFNIGFLLALAGTFCFSSSSAIRKIGLNYIDSAVVGLAVSSFGSLIIFVCYFFLKKRWQDFKNTSPQARNNYLIAGLYTTLATFSYFLALKTVPVAITVTIANTEPIFVILLSKFVFKQEEEFFDFQLLLKIFIIFSGVFIITMFN